MDLKFLMEWPKVPLQNNQWPTPIAEYQNRKGKCNFLKESKVPLKFVKEIFSE